MIRVLLIAPSLAIVGGQGVQAQRLREAFAGHPEVTLEFLPTNPALPDWLRRIKYVRTVAAQLLFYASLLRRLWRVDILHIFTASFTSYSLWTIPSLALAKLAGRPAIVNYRDGRAPEHLRDWPSAVPTLRWAAALVAPNDYLVKEVFAAYGLQSRSIPNVLRPEQFHFRQRPALRPVFLHNRSLEPVYDIDCTLKAFARIQREVPAAELRIAHEGPLRAHLEQVIAGLGLRGVTFTGKIPPAQVAGSYDEVDIYLTSPLMDCNPGSILEAFASGVAVVATTAGGIPYVARHEETALLVPVGDDQAMAAQALRLLRDPALAQRLTAQARQACLHYQAAEVASQWTALYRQLLSR